jgi:phenylalanyl-tRNA synthetase beta chain
MNYVMLELGQPMHAFDLAKLKGGIHVRNARELEQLKLLDGQEVTLNEQVLVIADDEKPLALAGIMGGAESAVQINTQDVFLESAFFNPIGIAGVARSYGLFSDSSQRYERGVDPYLQINALERATSLVLSIAGGKAGPIVESCELQHLPPTIEFTFDTTQVKRLTGLSIPLAEMRHLLEGLDIVFIREEQEQFVVKIPSHRFDIQHNVDLVEEIIRLHGYNNLHAQGMNAFMQAGTDALNEDKATQLALWFSTKGYHETISYSFVDPEIQQALYPKKEVKELLNPISSELSQMRVGLWPGLIASMIYNLHRQQNFIKFFESGVVFDVENQHLFERACIAGLVMGEQGNLNWNETSRCFDFYDLKGDLQSLFSLLKIKNVTFHPEPHDALHPGQSAQIVIEGKQAGWIGALHPRLSDALDINQEVLLFELDLDILTQSDNTQYQSISKYPQIRRDLSFLVDEKVTAGQIEKVVRDAIKENWLKTFNVFDVYTGTGIPEGKKSLAIAMILQDNTRTLVDAEINLLINAIIKSLENNFSIILRE